MSKKHLTTAADVLDAIGRARDIAKLCGVSSQATSNWRRRGSIAAEYYDIFCRELNRLGITADPAIWSQHKAHPGFTRQVVRKEEAA
jgi:hypothetical protein